MWCKFLAIFKWEGGKGYLIDLPILLFFSSLLNLFCFILSLISGSKQEDWSKRTEHGQCWWSLCRTDRWVGFFYFGDNFPGNWQYYQRQYLCLLIAALWSGGMGFACLMSVLEFIFKGGSLERKVQLKLKVYFRRTQQVNMQSRSNDIWSSTI